MFAVPQNTLPPHASAPGRAIAHPVRIAHEFAASRERWAHVLRYDPDQRWVGLLERTEEHEVWLLSWLPGQRTELHDHGGATGAFTVVSGSLTERAIPLDRGAVETSRALVAGQSRVFGPSYVHQVRNDGEDPAVSIHVYRPARSRMRIYSEDPAGAGHHLTGSTVNAADTPSKAVVAPEASFASP